MRIECFTNDKEFRTLKEEWNKLLFRSTVNTIFLTWEWMFTWWKYYGQGKRLFIVTVRDKGGELLGLAPLCIKEAKAYGLTSMKTLTFLGSGEVCSDYLDFIISAERNEDILKAILEYLESHSRQWNYTSLSDISESSSNLDYIKEILRLRNIDFLVI